jgi:hypothetical protein
MLRQTGVRTKEILVVLLIVLLCVLTRLPQLLSKDLLLDSDECIVALMAKHMCGGKDFSVFFYGQSYGFSLVETAAISLFSLPAGITDIAVKLAMLALWTTGVVFFYKTLKEVIAGNRYIAVVVTLLLIYCPAWAVWSMKARGGYLTAFMCSNMICWLLLRKNRSYAGFATAGVLMVLVLFSQPLWLPGLLPVLVYALVRHRKAASWLCFGGGLLPALIVLMVLKHQASNYWKPEVFQWQWPALKNINHACALLTDHFHAWYYLDQIFPASLGSRVSAGMMMALLIVIIAAAVFFVVRSFRNHLLFVLFACSVLFTLGYALFLATDAPRYLLPLSGFMFFALALLLQKISGKAVVFTVCAPFFIAGSFALYSFRDYTFVPFTRADLHSSIRYLEQHHVRYVFSNDGLLEWQLMYYSDEQIICRESNLKDRLPAYVRQVNDAYRHAPQTTAVIDFYGDLPDMAPGKVVMTGGKFAVVLQPDEQLLRDMEFAF